jgi:3-hydroxyisobutyrate dehydrogenase
MIAHFGTGLLGANFIRAFCRRGVQVQVWNRTGSKALALEEVGARSFDDPAQAASGAERIHLTLSDDDAVDDVLERARAGFARGVVIVDHTTTSPTGTRARAHRWADRGVAFQHAPVFMGPQNALDATGIMLASGERALFDSLSPELAKMTGKLIHLGVAPERAAGFKLLGNLLLMYLTTGLAEMLSLGKALGISAAETISLLDAFNPGQTLPARAKRIVDAGFEHPSWELSMARKDARLMIEEAVRADRPLAVLPAIAELMDRFIADGHGADDWTVIARDAL